MRTSLITVAVLATLASVSALEDAQTAIGVDCSTATDTAVEGCDISKSASEACAAAGEIADGAAWVASFKTCIDADSSDAALCACYKKFMQDGFNNGCQTNANLNYAAAQGIRYGVGAPLFTGSSNNGTDSCTTPNLSGNVYNGAGTIFTAPFAGECLPACAQICSTEQCSSASATGPAAVVASVVAIAAYYLN